jgi:hypothetical protein
MRARLNWNERMLVIESEAVRRDAVGCIVFHEKAVKFGLRYILIWVRCGIGLPCGLLVVVHV